MRGADDRRTRGRACGRQLAILRSGPGFPVPGTDHPRRPAIRPRRRTGTGIPVGDDLVAASARCMASTPSPDGSTPRCSRASPFSTRRPTTTCGRSSLPAVSAVPTLCCGAAPAAWRRRWRPACRRPGLPPLPRPILGLFGSDQSADRRPACRLRAALDVLRGRRPASRRRRRAPATHRPGAGQLSTCPPGHARAGAADRIARPACDQSDADPDPPGTLVVAGGETLRSLCHRSARPAWRCRAASCPAFPAPILRGGRWNGVTVVSKSGAFGHPHLLRDLLPSRLKGELMTPRPLAITMGDPAGIGPEIIVKAAADCYPRIQSGALAPGGDRQQRGAGTGPRAVRRRTWRSRP